MNAKPYTPEMRAADTEMAKAMGWTEVEMETGSFPRLIGVPPSGNEIHIMAGMGRFREVPRFHESHDARAALLEWIRAQGKLTMRRFLSILHGTLSDTLRFTDRPEYMIVEMMCVTPAQVAEAALRVIQENNK